ncbi:DUF397 domain-containing protein [Streptomyces sp. NPDC001100]
MIEWQKSTFSSGSDGSSCVELAYGEGELLLRESDDPARILPVAPSGLAALLRRLHGRGGTPLFTKRDTLAQSDTLFQVPPGMGTPPSRNSPQPRQPS